MIIRALTLIGAALSVSNCASTEARSEKDADVAGTTVGGGMVTSAMKGTLYAPGRKFGQSYCGGCHAEQGNDPKQKVAYPAFHVDSYEDWASGRTILLAVLDKWSPDGDVMPPPDAVEPPDAERRLILDWVRRGSPNTAEGQ
jgi:hypothetical protein